MKSILRLSYTIFFIIFSIKQLNHHGRRHFKLFTNCHVSWDLELVNQVKNIPRNSNENPNQNFGFRHPCKIPSKSKFQSSVSEFNEFKPRLKSPQNRFQLSAGLNLEKLNTIFKWNQPYLSRGSNSLNSASGLLKKVQMS